MRDERIPCSDTVEICRFLEQDNHLHVYDGDRFFVNENDGFLAMYERICRVHGILTPRAVSRTVEAEHVSANKIVAMCEAEKQAELLSGAVQDSEIAIISRRVWSRWWRSRRKALTRGLH